MEGFVCRIVSKFNVDLVCAVRRGGVIIRIMDYYDVFLTASLAGIAYVDSHQVTRI